MAEKYPIQPSKSIDGTTHTRITDAAQDPRFDTFYKRLEWFRDSDETDRGFAERLGVSRSTFRAWKLEA